jgi:cytochrome P450
MRTILSLFTVEGDTDMRINGVPVAKGQMIYLGWASANLDPAVVDRPLDVGSTAGTTGASHP